LIDISYDGSHVLIMCRQTPIAHTLITCEPSYVISIKYRLSIPDDGSYVIRNNVGVIFNVC